VEFDGARKDARFEATEPAPHATQYFYGAGAHRPRELFRLRQ